MRAASQRRERAGGLVAARDVEQRRQFMPAFLDRERTARMEPAAGGKRGGVGNEPLDRAKPLLLEMQARDRAEQADGVRMLRLGEQARGAAALDHLTGVH